MATAAVIVGGALIGSSKIAKSNIKAAELQAESAEAALAASQEQQAIENARAEALFDPAMQAQQTQLALLGQGGDEAAQTAAQSLLTSPLVSALNEQNQQNILAQAASSGVSGGNLLTALQDANTSTILNAGFSGLGSIAGQNISGAQGFGGLASNALAMGNQQQNLVGQFQGQAAQAQGTLSALPYLTASNFTNQALQMGLSAATGGATGFGGMGSTGTAQPTTGGGGTMQSSGYTDPFTF